jgi:hypothetical protein
MKKLMTLLMVCCAAGLAGAGYPGQVLFSDNYNRANSTDIDSSSVGMAGTLAPMVYVEAFEGSGVATSIQILNNLLNVAMGPGMGSLFLDYNLIDASILTSDGFSVSMDVVSITTADDTGNRFGGFGVGHTRDEALAARDSFDSAAPFRPSLARANQGIGVSDFYVDLALDQNLRIWSKGALLETINVGVATGTIRVDFYVADFNAGSTVDAEVYFNGVKKSVKSFTWDHTDNNYLGISGRTAAAGVLLDNLSVATFYSEKANTPVPVNGATGVDSAGVVLEWNKGKDTGGNPNAGITKHYLYIAENEPNFANVTPITVADSADPVTHDPVVIDATDTDKTFYWRVDESVLINGIPSGPTDPNTIQGFVWKFETVKSVPIINTQPVNQLVEPAQTAEFSIAVSSMSPLTYAWYQTGDNAVDTPADDTLVGQSRILSIPNAQVANEGYYYCKLVNTGGAVLSNVVTLGVKRAVAHWTLDAADFVGGVYLDSSGEGHHAEPNILPTTGSFVAGADPAETGDALDTTVVPLSVADSGDWAASAFTSQITVSAWVKWAGTNGAWQGIVSNRVDPSNGNFYIEIRQDNGNVQIGSPGGTDLIAGNLPVGQWTHLAVTASSSDRIIYINGTPAITRSPANPITQLVVPMYVGALGRSTAGTLSSPFNGVIDDVRIYNYAKDKFGVADLYYDVVEIPVCLNPGNVGLQFDVAGGGASGDQPDCRVDLMDFAVFAGDWLNCGLYPHADCQ